MEQRGPSLVEQLVTLASAGIMVWVMMPPQERLWVQLRMVGVARRYADRLARLEGHAGMGDELAGRDPWSRYGGAVLAGRCRDRLDRVLTDMKP